MNIIEAIQWLSPNSREHIIKQIEKNNMNGVEIVDLVVGHYNMACKKILQELYRLADTDELMDATKKLLTNNN